MYGLGQFESSALQTLSPKWQRIVAAELDDPESREGIAELLREKDPALAIARQYALEVVDETRVFSTPKGFGLQDSGMGKKGLKKVFKKAVKVVKVVAKKIGKTVLPFVAPAFPVLLASKRYRKMTMKWWKKNIPLVLTVAGAVLAPFTGGASLAAAAALNAGYAIGRKKIEAKAAVKAQKKEAAALEAAVAAQEVDLMKQADDVYSQNKDYFAAAGITSSRWGAMTLEQKLSVLEKGSKGELPADPAVVAESKSDPVKDAEEAAKADAAYAGLTPEQKAAADAQAASWANWMASLEAQAPAPAPAAVVTPTPKATVMPSAIVPTPTVTPPAAAEAPVPEAVTAGAYEVYVEGKLVAQATSLSEAAKEAKALTAVGDRFEVMFNGKSTGLKILTVGGIISVPPAGEATVRTATHDQVKAMLEKATDAAKESGAAPSGGIPWWVFAGGAAAAAVAALKG